MNQLTYEEELKYLEDIAASRSRLSDEEQQDLEERLVQAREDVRQERIDKDYQYLEHQKALNAISLENEIAYLEKMRNTHQLNAEELASIDEKLFSAKQNLRNRDIASLDSMANGVIEALSNRYQAMLDTEQAQLEASKDRWQAWSDENVKAIQAQIDALDALLQTEDREAQDEKELKNIAKLQENIMFEQDDYARRQLQQQLEKAMADREARLRKQALQDQKDALKKEMEAVREKASAEMDAIDKQKEATDEAYQERMKDSNLQAEAERLLMASGQDELLGLIAEYAPDYNLSGKSLGEKWMEGFYGAVSNVEGFMNGLIESLSLVQAQAAQLALNSADAFYGAQQGTKEININNEYVFNVPVESPYDTARRIEKADQDLARLL